MYIYLFTYMNPVGIRDPESVSDDVSLYILIFVDCLRCLFYRVEGTFAMQEALVVICATLRHDVLPKVSLFIIFLQQDTRASCSHLLSIYLSWLCETNALEAGLGGSQLTIVSDGKVKNLPLFADHHSFFEPDRLELKGCCTTSMQTLWS